jgi:broad specificity phosphatase PhoE
MELFLIRHGEASASWGESSDPGLSLLGQQQAEETAEALQQHVLCSARVRQLYRSPECCSGM